MRAQTVSAYIEALPPERRAVVKKLRQTLKKHLPRGFQETMGYGMLAYVVPHSVYPEGYHADPELPLPFINVGSQKQYVSLYHMGLYDGALLAWFKKQWPRHTTAKLDMGRCCIRFKNLDDIPYALVGELAAKMTPGAWVKAYQDARRR